MKKFITNSSSSGMKDKHGTEVKSDNIKKDRAIEDAKFEDLK